MLKVLFVASESVPFKKTGGLADVVGTLPIEINKKGHDARVIIPLYKSIKEKFELEYLTSIKILIGWREQYCGIFTKVYDNTTFYFIDNEFYFGGNEPYDYIHLDCEKFIFFSKAVLSCLPTLDFKPDVINCNDWQTGAIPVFLDTFLDNPFYQNIKTIMSIHNIKYQGRWDFNKIKDFMGISDYYFTQDKLEHYHDANLLKGGLVYATKIVAVSPTYAKEIENDEASKGLGGLLRARNNDIVGIVNGISYDEWNPQNDKKIYNCYDSSNAFNIRKINKTELQKELNLEVSQDIFTIGIVSRLTEQKGMDLVLSVTDELVNCGIQLIVLGTGEDRYENAFREKAFRYPSNVSSNIYFNDEMSHKIYSSCDMLLMPSLFEPCGISQLIAMHYGMLPLVRETGGLCDTVIAYNEYTHEGTGFSFQNYNRDDMLFVINYAKNTYYNNQEDWKKMVVNAMNKDFSWNNSCNMYLELFKEITK